MTFSKIIILITVLAIPIYGNAADTDNEVLMIALIIVNLLQTRDKKILIETSMVMPVMPI